MVSYENVNMPHLFMHKYTDVAYKEFKGCFYIMNKGSYMGCKFVSVITKFIQLYNTRTRNMHFTENQLIY